MKRSIHKYALAILLGTTGAHALAQASSGGVADPQAPVPATGARPAIDLRTGPAPAMSRPGHDHRARMDMGACCCADMKQDGCCCHKETT